MNILGNDDISIDILANWLSPKDIYKVHSLRKKENREIKELRQSGNFIVDTPVPFRKEILRSGILFTKIKVVLITGDLIEYLQYLGDRLEKLFLCNCEDVNNNHDVILNMIPHEKIEYDFHIAFFKDKIGNRKVFIPDNASKYEIDTYIETHGHKIEELLISSMIMPDDLNHILRLVERYCINLKALNCMFIHEDLYLPSLETVINCATLDRLSRCTNIRSVIRCSNILPKEFINLKTVYRCVIYGMTEEICNNLEVCVCNMDDLNSINIDIIREISIPEEGYSNEEIINILKSMTKLNSIFIKSGMRSTMKEVLERNGIIDVEVFSLSGIQCTNNIALIKSNCLEKYQSIDELILRKKFKECDSIRFNEGLNPVNIGKNFLEFKRGKVMVKIRKIPIDTVIDIAIKCPKITTIIFPYHIFTKRQIKRLILSKPLFTLVCMITPDEISDIVRIMYKYHSTYNKFTFVIDDTYGSSFRQRLLDRIYGNKSDKVINVSFDTPSSYSVI